MKVLITGANGFVGRAVCRRLAVEGWALRGALRRQTALEPGIEPVHIAEIGPATDWRAALEGVEAVVHLAARVHVMQDKSADPLAAFRLVNRDGSLHLAEAAAAAGVKQFLFVSSVKVNGEATEPGRPFRPDDSVVTKDPYGLSKWEAEQGLAVIAARSDMAVTILRPPLVHGPGVGGNLKSLMAVLRKGIPLPLGLVENQRSLLGVDNLADAIACALKDGGRGCETFLLRDGEDVSTPRLIRMLAAGMGKTARLLPVPPVLLRLAGLLTGKGAAVDRLLGSLQLDDHAFRTRFGWSPPVTLEEGLTAMARWFGES